MKIIIVGPPGAGKGTYSDKISEIYDIPHIATGDIFREEIKKESELGKKVKKYLDEGELVPDETVNKVVKKRLSKPDCDNGFILDGYPRTINQAKKLEKVTEIDLVINLDVSDEIVIKRLSNRRICKNCSEIYNLKSKPPEKEGVCDKCGDELYQREDDKPEVIRKRLRKHKERIQPILDFYRKKELVFDITFKEEKSIEEAMDEIQNALDELEK